VILGYRDLRLDFRKEGRLGLEASPQNFKFEIAGLKFAAAGFEFSDGQSQFALWAGF
jgi:hypothetical protein